MNGIYKDYLTEDEAADYMCLSKSAFNKHKGRLGVLSYRFPGIAKNVYKRAELQSAMESNLKPRRAGISKGVMEASIALASIELKRRKR